MTHALAVRLMVVDDHNLFRRGLIALLSRDPRVQVVAEARDAGEALKLGAQHQPDVILLDNHLPGVHGVEALPQLCATVPRARIVMLTVSEDANDLAQALARGAAGYLLKTVEGDELVEAVLRAHRGESVLSPQMTGKLMAAYREVVSHPSPSPEPVPAALSVDALGQGSAQGASTLDRPKDEAFAPVSRLSPRENDILREIARGASNKEIARTLQIAETTVKIHVQHVLRKLDVSSRVHAAVIATSNGLV